MPWGGGRRWASRYGLMALLYCNFIIIATILIWEVLLLVVVSVFHWSQIDNLDGWRRLLVHT